MKIDINNLPNSAEDLKKMILDLHSSREFYRNKCEILAEEIRLAKQKRFALPVKKI